jgi:hypothetical protein
MVRVTCDGCGNAAEGEPELVRRWRQLTVELANLPNGEPIRRKSIDLCPTCIAEIVVPGLERGEA